MGGFLPRKRREDGLRLAQQKKPLQEDRYLGPCFTLHQEGPHRPGPAAGLPEFSLHQKGLPCLQSPRLLCKMVSPAAPQYKL